MNLDTTKRRDQSDTGFAAQLWDPTELVLHFKLGILGVSVAPSLLVIGEDSVGQREHESVQSRPL